MSGAGYLSTVSKARCELSCLAYFVAILTIHGAVVAGLEGDLGWAAALGADDIVHLPGCAIATFVTIIASLGGIGPV